MATYQYMEEARVCVKDARNKRPHRISFDLYRTSRKSKSREAESGLAIVWGRQEERAGIIINGPRDLFRVLEMLHCKLEVGRSYDMWNRPP